MHQTMSGFFPSEILRVLRNRAKHAQTVLPHCEIQPEDKHFPSENPMSPSYYFNQQKKQNSIFKKETNGNFHMD